VLCCIYFARNATHSEVAFPHRKSVALALSSGEHNNFEDGRRRT
jgi:hypothetical protein